MAANPLNFLLSLLQPSKTGSSGSVTGAIKQASNDTGASFEYLLATAKLESNFDPGAAAATSSAKGLFQFIEQTWLGTVKEAGAQFGYERYANAISRTSGGGYSVDDPQLRKEILQLRDDPDVSAAMAGVLSQSNSFKLTGHIGRRPSDGELYMAHFMGVGGAAKLIQSAQQTPQAIAAVQFPAAAAANQSIFYDRTGSARTVAQVYDVLNSRYANAASGAAQIAASGGFAASRPVTAAAAVAPLRPSTNVTVLNEFPDLSRAQVASFEASDQAGAIPAPTFRSLYHAGQRDEPVSSAVQQLWGRNAQPASAGPTQLVVQPEVVSSPQPSTQQGVRPLDLFSDRTGQFSG